MEKGGQLHGQTAPGTPWIRGWMCPITGLDDVKRRKNLTPESKPGRAAQNRSLYRLGYPNSIEKW
jgi:hypothetical protein